MLQKNEKGLLLGARAIIEAVVAGKSFQKIYVRKPFNHPLQRQLVTLAEEHMIPCQQVPLVRLQCLTNGHHRGAIGILAPIVYRDLATLVQSSYALGKAPLVVLLDRVQDVRNLGAIARSALIMGTDALVVPAANAAGITNDALEASMGALAYLPVCREKNFTKTIQYVKDSGLQVIACTEKGEELVYNIDFSLPTALLLGNEQGGILPKHVAMADACVRIPTYGPIDSLNVSVAAAIFLYEVAKQRTDGDRC